MVVYRQRVLNVYEIITITATTHLALLFTSLCSTFFSKKDAQFWLNTAWRFVLIIFFIEYSMMRKQCFEFLETPIYTILMFFQNDELYIIQETAAVDMNQCALN